MTITTVDSPAADDRIPLRPVAFDLYRDIHKGIRAELFSMTERAGRIDPSSRDDRQALADHVKDVVWLLESHAEHEDDALLAIMEEHIPHLATQVATDHHRLDARLGGLLDLAEETVGSGASSRRVLHSIYVELAAFVSAYLAHQDLEERVIMPALEAALGVEAIIEIHERLVGNIPPDELARSLAIMLPAMNIDDRTEMLGGMRASAPPEVFAGVWRLAGSVIEAPDHQALATRLGLT